jgi:GNAT superfamily N-acetyltransferase
MDCTVRTMARDEVDLAIDLAAAEGWNPGLHDAACFRAADAGGFFVAESEGRPIGCISAVGYGASFGFIGLYIVVPAWRGLGVGSKLWAAGMARLAGRVIGLDGVPAQQPYYRRKGFELAWQNARFAGPARASGGCPAQIVPLASVDFAAVEADDRRVFPAPRSDFLRAWLAMADARCLAWVEGGRLRGWALLRRCRDGHKFGPLVADDPQVAAGLYDTLCATVAPGEIVNLDVPLLNNDAVALARSRGLRIVFETARMYAGPAPRVELAPVYGVTTFELG